MRRAFPVIFLFLLLLGGCSSPPADQIMLSDAVAHEALGIALTRVGSPYVLAAQGPNQFDCSGLVVWSYRGAYPGLMLRDETGMVDDANADTLWRQNIKRVEPSGMRPGDLVFTSFRQDMVTHVGLFNRWLDADRFEVVNASSYHGAVVVEPWTAEGLIRGTWFVGAGRLRATRG